MTIPDPLAIHAIGRPDAVAVVEHGHETSWRELDKLVYSRQGLLQGAGIRPGDRVGILLGDSVRSFVTSLWAVLRERATAVPVSNRLPAAAIRSFAEEVPCSIVISDGEEISGLKCLQVSSGGQDDNTGVLSMQPHLFDPDAYATICRTSGSTSLPKGAVHTTGNHFYSAWGSNERVPLLPGDRWLLTIPLNHVGGLAVVFRCLIAGASIVADTSRDVAGLVKEYGATHVSLVATQLIRVLEAGDLESLRGMRSVLCGGSAIPSGVLRRAVDANLPIQVTYGMTEASSQIATTEVLTRNSDVRLSGYPLRHTRVRIDTDGEILIQGPTVFAGYLTDGRVEVSMGSDGWFRTGDLGSLREEGLEVYGRKDNMFISGGENIKPEEIEFFLSSDIKVQRAVIVPVDHFEYGKTPVAFIQWSETGNFGDLVAALREKLPGFKVPKYFFELPAEYRDISKIDRNKLQDVAAKQIAARL